MNQLTNETLPALPSEWIDRLWQRFLLMYGNKFSDMWRDLDPAAVKRAWAEDLAGYTGAELKRGLEWCKTQKWPPTLPEFMTACRPVMDSRTEWAEACEQMRIRLEGRGADTWSRPQVYWAAVAIGWYDLNSTAWEQIRSRWTKALSDAKADPIPEYRAALPAPGKASVTREDALDRMGKLRGMVEAVSLPGTTKAGTKWAVRLMEREAGGEALHSISSSAWRDVLGFTADIDAKKALESTKQQQEAA